MIKINLLGTESVQDSKGALWLVGYGASVALLLLAFAIMYTAVSSETEVAQADVASLEQRLAALQKITQEVQELEKKKKDLHDKLVVIAKLKKSKLGPVQSLDDLNISLPERAWLTSVDERSGFFRIFGFAIDNQTIASFMRQLDESSFFSDVQLVETKQANYKEAKVKSFILQAKVDYTGTRKPVKEMDESKGGEEPAKVKVN